MPLEKHLRVLAELCVDGGWCKRESLSVDSFPGNHLNLPHRVADFVGVGLESVISFSRILSPLEEATEIVHGGLGCDDITFCGLTQALWTRAADMMPQMDVVFKDVSGARIGLQAPFLFLA